MGFGFQDLTHEFFAFGRRGLVKSLLQSRCLQCRRQILGQFNAARFEVKLERDRDRIAAFQF